MLYDYQTTAVLTQIKKNKTSTRVQVYEATKHQELIDGELQWIIDRVPCGVIDVMFNSKQPLEKVIKEIEKRVRQQYGELITI